MYKSFIIPGLERKEYGLTLLRSEERKLKIFELLENFGLKYEGKLFGTKSIETVKRFLNSGFDVYKYEETGRVNKTLIFSKLSLEEVLDYEELDKKYHKYLRFVNKYGVYSGLRVFKDKTQAVLMFEEVEGKCNIEDIFQIEKFQEVLYKGKKYTFLGFHINKETGLYNCLVSNSKGEYIGNLDISDITF